MSHGDHLQRGKVQGERFMSGPSDQPAAMMKLLEAADMFGISRSTAYRQAHKALNGDPDAFPVKVFRIGSQLKVSRAEVTALLQTTAQAS